MNRDKFGLREFPEDIPQDEPVRIHTQCRKCDAPIILPEKVWLKRGSICDSCYRNIREE